MKKIRSSQAAIPCTELSKTQLFPVNIVKYVKWENLDWTGKFLLLKIPPEPRYCERLTGISKR